MKFPAKRKSLRTWRLIVALGLVVCSVIGVIWYTKTAKQNTSPSAPAQTINMEKSSAELTREKELQANPAEKTKNQSDTPIQPTVSETTGKQQVNVILTTAGVYDGIADARGYIANSVESTGTCIYTFSSTNNSRTIETSPLPGPSSTTCSTAKIDASLLSSGSWTVYLEFSSSISYGKSAPKEFIVP